MSETATETPTTTETTPRPKTTTKHTGSGNKTPVIPLTMVGIGLYLLWFGVHYWRDGSVKWPTDPIKAVLTGKGVPKQTAQASWTSVVTAAESQGNTVGGSTSTGGDTGAGSATAAKNQQLGKMLAASYGWSTGPAWDSLVKLWNKESGWDNTARNPSSGAYGIAQALPPTKYPKSAQAPPVGSSDPTTQIQWGLSYIFQRYGSPINAWNHEVSAGWY